MLSAADVPADDTVLPLFDAPCEGSRIEASPDVTDPVFRGARFVLCVHEGGAIGIREDLPTTALMAGVYPAPGQVLVGGPLGLRQGVLIYSDGDGLRWTTSHRRARELGRSDIYLGMMRASGERGPRLAFGHAAWAAGQLEAEIAAGAWVVLEPPQSRR